MSSLGGLGENFGSLVSDLGVTLAAQRLPLLVARRPGPRPPQWMMCKARLNR